jgi:hypothetical protein
MRRDARRMLARFEPAIRRASETARIAVSFPTLPLPPGFYTPAWQSAQNAAVKTLGETRWSAILSDLETAALALNK